MKKNISFMVFLFFAIICVTEGFLHKEIDPLITNCLQHTTLSKVLSYYPHGYCYDNDIDNEMMHPEGYGLMCNAYFLGGIFPGKSPAIYCDYPPDKYRILIPFLSSFFLFFTTLKNSYLIINIILWAVVSYAMWWLGCYIFNLKKIGLLAGFLCATSYAVIALIAGGKAEIFQLASYVLLIALSLRLNHFANNDSFYALRDSFILGLFSGILLFASFSSIYFLPFLFFYGIATSRFEIFIKRNAVLLLGLIAVYSLVTPFIKQPLTHTMFRWVTSQHFDLIKWWISFKLRIANHFILIVPYYLWIGAVGGLFLLNKRELKLILCILTVFFASEFIMVGANPYQSYTPAHYYLQILFPLYLLNAKFLYFLIFDIRNNNRFLLIFKRFIASVFIIVTLIVANLALIGNKYYSFVMMAPTPIELLYRSYFTFNNLYIYEDMYKKEYRK
ncbi:MAG: hypothetical protein AB1755_02495 [Candidatus Omnitrophota bacterium]